MAKTPGTGELKGLVAKTARAMPMPSAFVLNGAMVPRTVMRQRWSMNLFTDREFWVYRGAIFPWL
ncbi:hypothetical protein EST62_03885 [Chlorobaculum sp. 24CR]|uniref:hypothetical protein n=1 Tax=Chlorobaculum sp. 24CR TaxID=2508878 RepID=UPI00100AA333|nr:hypothetical protein [Chlorobaculum sp. 24CR]RXK88238.1 hypothetical protein EST62_03885 [Chlorobaculum sp. 24CR]